MVAPVTTTDAIAAVSESLLQALRDGKDDAPADLGLDESSFEHASSSTLVDRPEDLVTLWLYRVGPSQSRNRAVARFDEDGNRLRPSLLVDLHYMLTAWKEDPIQEQQLLGWCVRVLEDVAILPGGLLSQPSFPKVFGLTDQLELVWETVPWADYVTIWNVAQPSLAPSATYVVRNVPIDSTLVVHEYERVQTREFQYVNGIEQP
jgi:hypothetical protein